jgi:hypothetical protein
MSFGTCARDSTVSIFWVEWSLMKQCFRISKVQRCHHDDQIADKFGASEVVINVATRDSTSFHTFFLHTLYKSTYHITCLSQLKTKIVTLFNRNILRETNSTSCLVLSLPHHPASSKLSSASHSLDTPSKQSRSLVSQTAPQ